MPYTGPALGARPSFEPRHGKVRRGGRIDLKPGTRGPAGGSGASPVGPLGTLRQTATPSRKVSIRRIRARRLQPGVVTESVGCLGAQATCRIFATSQLADDLGMSDRIFPLWVLCR